MGCYDIGMSQVERMMISTTTTQSIHIVNMTY